ncbi:MAG: hypothetical protein U1F37_20295 [Alphaproteobacteria bacterium]
MTRTFAFALACSALGLAAPGAAQDKPDAGLLGNAIAPPLSVRAMPAAPDVHKLSIGPLSAPLGTAAPVPPESAASSVAPDQAERRAAAGDAESNYRLGLKYLAGDGMPYDYVEAFARIRLAAEAGHPRAIPLFYSMGARLTAEEHGKAFLRTQQLRQAVRAQR